MYCPLENGAQKMGQKVVLDSFELVGKDFDKYRDMNLATLNPMFSKEYYCESSHLTKKHL